MPAWERVEQLFADVIERPGEREALLAAETDAEVRAEVASLLANLGGARARIRGAIAGEAAELASEVATAFVGRRLGAYRIGERIGEGGMGAVYLAKRDDAAYEQEVAIKILQHGLGSAQAIARFRDERQILAALDHPGIVRLIDGGTTDEGLPYLVMEHVEGVPINRFEGSVRERVELVRRVCAAVQYAHQRLVVHRDLKPSNILVGADGAPKLLDFGIAKLIDPEAEREARTGTGATVLTPEYASPEQVRGEAVSVATDVYSLGAVLFELLAGRTPHAGVSSLEMLLAICDVDPPRPSTVAEAGVRRELAGDLDNIVLKALHKDPAQRYASVDHLAADLGRYLDGLPVLARTATLSYRAAKFVRRHRGKLAIAALTATALATATVVSVRQARRAEEHAERAERKFEQVRTLAKAMVFELDDKLQNVTGTTEARQLMVTRALEYLDGLAGEAGEDPQLSRELALAYIKVGDVQGNFYESNLGKTKDGLVSYRKATEVVERLLARGHDDLETRRAQVTAMLGTGVLEHWDDQVPQARARLVAGLEAHAALGLPSRFDRYVFRAYLSLAYIDQQAGDPKSAAAWGAKLLDVARAWHAAEATPDTRYTLAIALTGRADASMMAADPAQACHDLDASTAEFARLASEYPTDARFSRELAFNSVIAASCRSGYGNCEVWTPNTRDVAGAERLLRQAVAIAERLAADTNDVRGTSFVVNIMSQLGLLIGERDPREAAAIFERAIRKHEGLPSDVQNTDTDLWFLYCPSAESMATTGRPDIARAWASQGLAIALAKANEANAGFDDRLRLQMCRYLVARAYRALADHPRAIALLEEVATALDALLAERPLRVNSYIGLAMTLELLAELRPAEACALRDRAASVWRRWPQPATPFVTEQRAAIDARRASCSK